jgi:prolyl oligopeptidase
MRTHFGDFGWNGSGFYYGGYRKPRQNESGYSDERVLYHRLGHPQDQDQVVYEDTAHPKRKYLFLATYDHRFLLLHILEHVDGKAVGSEWFRREGYVRAAFKPLQGTLAPGRFFLCDNAGDHLILFTQYKSPQGRIIDVDTRHPEEANWKEFAAGPILDAESVLGKIVVVKARATGGTFATIVSLGGKVEKVIPTEDGSAVDIQSCNRRERYIFVSTEKAGTKRFFQYDYAANRLSAFN